MKRMFTIILAVAGIMLAAAVIFMPAKATSSLKPDTPAAGLPDSIMKIVQNSCMDCHASDGNAMAKSHVNFSEWSNYKPEKQAEKAQLMCKMLTKDAMPPKGWRKNNADRIPTEKQKKEICTWASKLNP